MERFLAKHKKYAFHVELNPVINGKNKINKINIGKNMYYCECWIDIYNFISNGATNINLVNHFITYKIFILITYE